MPQTNPKKRASNSGGNRKSSRKSSTKAKSNTVAKKSVPMRREVGGAVCFFLALLGIISYFRVDAIFISFYRDLLRGLIGAGYYWMPPMLLLASFALVFHHGRPVLARVLCILLMPLIFGSFAHLIIRSSDYEWSFLSLLELFHSGVSGNSGGMLSGFAAEALAAVISTVGAGIFFFVASVLMLLRGFNMTISSIARAIKERPRPTYELDDEDKLPPDPAKKIVNHVAQKQIDRRQRKRISAYDLPVDDPPDLPSTQKTGDKTAMPTEESEDPMAYFDETHKEETESAPQIEKPLPTKVKPLRRYEKAIEKQSEVVSVEGRSEEHGSSMIEEVDAFLADIQVQSPSLNDVAAVEQAMSTVDKVSSQEAKQAAIDVALEIDRAEQPVEAYIYPSTELLLCDDERTVDGTDEMRMNVERLNRTLQNFSIDAHITNVIRGPSVTRYEVELDAGVKLSKLTNLADDIALNLGAAGVRIAAIPDKISIVGIEVPNKQVSTVFIREVLESKNFKNHKSSICFAVGKDIGGNCIVGDIAKLPHMLIAGTTGSGKSVCTNSLIVSLLYKSTPEDVRLIMVDPKMVELGVYNGIPHLLIPVVTDPKKAAGALQWAVTEMMRRYKTLADAKVRDIDEYNRKIAAADSTLKLPRIVVVIDELADLMLVAAKEVEESICRVAQMGRASGMHLVIATQRPSADVITGLMKANIPSRIAFAVASSLESRIILDTPGAEKLVGKGDMLYAPLGNGKPQRVQGCFITDGEVQAVVDHIKNGTEAQYSEEVMEQIDRQSEQTGKGSASAASADPVVNEHDEMFSAAVEVILDTKQASVSMLQRRLKLGYARAARIVDEMEEMGIVGPFEGSKPRQLLITKEQWAQMQGYGEPTPEVESVSEELPPREE